jgi:hypothetical protein
MDDKPQPASRPDGAHQSGESGGGPYPNPHSGRENPDFKGGDSNRSYYGGTQDDAENENAVTKEE